MESEATSLVCGCDRASLSRRGVVQHAKSGYWFVGKWCRWPGRGKASIYTERLERSYGVEHHLIVYCPFCGRLLPRRHNGESKP